MGRPHRNSSLIGANRQVRRPAESQSRCARRRAFPGQPSTPAREGEEETTMQLRFSVLLLSAFVLFFTHATYAQTTSSTHGATIHGTVYDPDGLVVPRAEIDLLSSLD